MAQVCVAASQHRVHRGGVDGGGMRIAASRVAIVVVAARGKPREAQLRDDRSIVLVYSHRAGFGLRHGGAKRLEPFRMPAVVVVCEANPHMTAARIGKAIGHVLAPLSSQLAALRGDEAGELAVVLKLRVRLRLLEDDLPRHELTKQSPHSACQGLARGAPRDQQPESPRSVPGRPRLRQNGLQADSKRFEL